MSQDHTAHGCKTTVLTLASAGIRHSDALPAWVERVTGGRDYDLLAVPDFRELLIADYRVIASDIATAVALHNGERLLSFTEGGGSGLLLNLITWLVNTKAGADIIVDRARGIPDRIPLRRSETLVIGCMDFRLHRQDAMMQALGRALCEDSISFDLLTTAGSAKELQPSHARCQMVKNQLVSCGYRRVILLSHEDCGKYGGRNAFSNHAHEMAQLSGDLCDASRALSSHIGDLDVVSGIVHLAGDTVDHVTIF